ncbi:MAG: sulfotransferase [Rhizomicrobium sp.]
MNAETPVRFSAETIQIVRMIGRAAEAGNRARAFELANVALDSGARHPMLFNVRAKRFWHEGLYYDALIDIQSALEFAPQDPLFLSAAGECLMKLGLWKAACSAFDSAIAKAPHLVQAHYRRGLALQMSGERQPAFAAHMRAVELEPDHAGALGSLALISLSNQNPQKFEYYADRALAQDASQPTAQIALSMAYANAGATGAAEERVREILRIRRFGDDPRASDVLRELGDKFDHAGNVALAFTVYTEVNRRRREIHSRRFAKIRLSRHVARLTNYFENAVPWTMSSIPAPEKDGPIGHAFVLGFARSGTTLLETVLASNAQVVALDEKDCFPGEATQLLEGAAGLESLSTLGEDDLARMRRAYWEKVREHGRSVAGKLFVDKWPFNSRRLPLIARLFPAARVLFMVRDPRDIVLSCFRRSFTVNTDTFEFLDLEDCACFYAAVMELAESSGRCLPLHLHRLRYEDMIAEFDATLRVVCDFIGIRWDERMRDFGGAADGTLDINAQSGIQVRKGLYAGASGQWRRYREQLAPILPILQPWIERFEYSPS